jgi:hypothetical protein
MSGHCPMLGGLYVPGGQRTVEPRRRIRRALTAIGAHQDVVDIVEEALLQIEEESWHKGREKGLYEGREAMRRKVLAIAGAMPAFAGPGPAGGSKAMISLSPVELAEGLAEVKRVLEDMDQTDCRFTE